MNQLTDEVRGALERLIAHAQRDSGQSRRVAEFLLAWWNPEECGGFHLTAMWGLDDAIALDVLTVFTWVAQHNVYPDALGYGKQFEAMVREWRPHLIAA